jgi:phosphohistidine swiveling domain-containing protein
MSLVVSFDQPEAGLASLVGGKGMNLIILTAAGFPVPPGFVVTAVAYQQFLDGLDWLDAELARFDYANPDHLREQCARLRARLARVSLPIPVREAVHTELTRFADRHDGNGAAWAVRSSSTFEDLAQAAFAGQHDTYLNIRGADAVAERIRDCFVSLWEDRAVLYRYHQGFSQREARMAVVVQRQVESENAGVGFSINPVSGRVDQLVLDANYGLGESVVAGECEVDHFELDKTTLQVMNRVLGHKEKMVAATSVGVEEREVSPDLADQPCLTDEQLRAVAQLLLKVEGHYGWPQDIEWGWQRGTLYLFQSRPVTTIQPRWTRDESAERFPNPMTPLTWDFIKVAFRGSMAHSLALMGLPPLQGDWFQIFDDYIYGNQNAVALIAAYRPLRARSVPELVAEIPALRRRYAWVMDLPVNWARDLDRYLIRLGRLSAVSLDGADIPQIWKHITEALAVGTEYFRPNIAISMTQAFLHRLLHLLVAMVVGKDQALSVVDGLLAGCETKTAVVNRELHELAQLAKKTPELRQELLNHPGQELWDGDRLAAYPDFAARFRRFLEDHGHREMDMDHYIPTWSGRPGIVVDSIALIVRGGGDEDPAETARQQRQRFSETEHRFLAALPDDVRFFFRELIRLARTYTTLDDLEHYQTTRMNPVARDAALALGHRLQQRGILDRPEDVYFFSKTDVEEMVAAFPHENGQVYRDKVYRAKQAYEASRERTPAWSLEERGTEKLESEGAETLRGLPGSPGRVMGPCFCVHDPADFARFPRGAILVARTTNPAWTPLFYSAAGLITESGGPLSHGAVTAREMRLPAVMSVRGAMSRFSDGQVVIVDGTQGVVRREVP